MSDDVEHARAARTVAAVLGAVVAVNLWSLRHLRADVAWPNDLDFHRAMVSWATGQFDSGRIPFDGWFPTLSAGIPQFHHYQSLPHLITGAAGVLLGPGRALHLALWLLVATWPVPVYIGGRALGLDRVGALAGALVAPLLRSATGYGFEPFSYLWIGNGLWSQAWGMWMAPLALGWTARAVRTGEHRRRAVAATALTLAFHLPTGWFVVLSVGLWVVIAPGVWRRRVRVAAWIGWRSVLAACWVVIPFIVDRWATNDSSFNGQGAFADSFGWRRVVGWTFAGDLVDSGRVPILSIVAALGLVLAIVAWRQARPAEREVVALFGAALLLFVGRDPFGPVIALIPGSSQVFLHRYIAIVQLAAVWSIGIAASRAWAWWEARPASALTTLTWSRSVAAGVAAVAILLPAVRSTHRLVDEDRSWVAAQARADAAEGADARALLGIARRRGPGRVFGGRLNGTGVGTVGNVPLPIWLAHEQVDAIGFNLRVSALSADLETYLDPGSIADLDELGVRYLLLREGAPVVAGTTFVARRGVFGLWEVPGDGLLSVADLVGPVERVGNDELAARLLPVMRLQGWSPDAVHQVVLEGRTPVGLLSRAGTGAPGDLSHRWLRLDDGRAGARVDLRRRAVVVLRANYHPRWRATVDGRPAPVLMVAPTWMAVEVPAGEHRVLFDYQPWPYTPLLLGLAVLAIVLPPLSTRRMREKSTTLRHQQGSAGLGGSPDT